MARTSRRRLILKAFTGAEWSQAAIRMAAKKQTRLCLTEIGSSPRSVHLCSFNHIRKWLSRLHWRTIRISLQSQISWITRQIFFRSMSLVLLTDIQASCRHRQYWETNIVRPRWHRRWVKSLLLVTRIDSWFAGSYTFAKTLEYKAKQGLTSNGKDVTVMPPAEYQERFVGALDRYILPCPGQLFPFCIDSTMLIIYR